jgi:hypothetical protein
MTPSDANGPDAGKHANPEHPIRDDAPRERSDIEEVPPIPTTRVLAPSGRRRSLLDRFRGTSSSSTPRDRPPSETQSKRVDDLG